MQDDINYVLDRRDKNKLERLYKELSKHRLDSENKIVIVPKE